MPSELSEPIRALSSLGEMRVWSLVITIFGDAVAPRNGVVPASALQAILERLGVKPEATRVALHRLVKDGWITRQKSGRQSYYGLTRRGEDEFLTARRRIYADAPQLHDPWRLVVGELGDDASDLIPIAPSVWLGHSGSHPPEAAMVLSGTIDALPDWVATKLAPDPLQSDYVQLEAALETAEKHPPSDAAEAAALRILGVHQWRRLLLRHPDLPPSFFPKGWRGEACRAIFISLHETLSLQADPWLDRAIGRFGGAD